MEFLSFFDEFPNLVHSELRNIFVTTYNKIFRYIKPGNYAFLEMFCSDIDCDCRKVIIQVVTANPTRIWAILNYGWETESFYQAWFGKQKSLYQHMAGVYFDPPTTDLLKNEFLQIVKNMILTDHKYAKRIEVHYQMFKEAMKKKVLTT